MGDLARVKLELARCEKSGGCVNGQDEDGGTALVYVSNQGELEIVRVQLDAGAWQDLHNPEGSALMQAAHKNRLGVLQLLLDSGGLINAETDCSSLRSAETTKECETMAGKSALDLAKTDEARSILRKAMAAQATGQATEDAREEL